MKKLKETKMTEQDINRLERRIYDLSSRLTDALGELSIAASEIFGQQLIADLTEGNEIEFRRIGNDDVVNDCDCIRIEEIKKLL